MSIGFQINQYQDDFGIVINATSPFFIYQKVAVRLRSNLMFNEHLKNQETTWTPYLNATVGLLGEAGWIGDSINLYSEGGDRKSTRLNSSHVAISYAVFCL